MTDTPESLIFPDDQEDLIERAFAYIDPENPSAVNPIFVKEPPGYEVTEHWIEVRNEHTETPYPAVFLPAIEDAHAYGVVIMPNARPDATDETWIQAAGFIAKMIELYRGVADESDVAAILQVLETEGLTGTDGVHRISLEAYGARTIRNALGLENVSNTDDETPKLSRRVYELSEPAALIKQTADSPEYWESFARDLFAHAAVWIGMKHALVVKDPIRNLDADALAKELESVEGFERLTWNLEDDPEPPFTTGELTAMQYSTAVRNMARSERYVLSAYQHLYTIWQRVSRYDLFTDALQRDIEDRPDHWQALVKQARADLGLPPAEPAAPPKPKPKEMRNVPLPIEPTRAAYIDGLGHAPTVSAWIQLQSVSWEPWQVEPGTWPQQHFVIDRNRGPLNPDGGRESGYVRFTFQENPNGATDAEMVAAHEMAGRINPVVGRVAFELGVMYTQKREHNGRIVTDSTALARRVYGLEDAEKVRPAQRRNVNEAMYLLGHIVVQHIRYYKKVKGKRDPVSNDPYPALHLLMWNQLNKVGNNVTYDIFLGEPIVTMFQDFPKQVVGVPAGTLALDPYKPAISRFRTEMLNRSKITGLRKKAENTGITFREILEKGGECPDEVKRQNRPAKRQLAELMIDAPELWKHKAPNTRGLQWDQWLNARVRFEFTGPDETDDETDDDESVTPPPGVHPGWQTPA